MRLLAQLLQRPVLGGMGRQALQAAAAAATPMLAVVPPAQRRPWAAVAAQRAPLASLLWRVPAEVVWSAVAAAVVAAGVAVAAVALLREHTP